MHAECGSSCGWVDSWGVGSIGYFIHLPITSNAPGNLSARSNLPSLSCTLMYVMKGCLNAKGFIVPAHFEGSTLDSIAFDQAAMAKEASRATWKQRVKGFAVYVDEYCRNCTLVGFAYIANGQ